MNAKLALALILVLQVSVSLCQEPTPSTDVVEKYVDLRDTFLKRLTVLSGRIDDYLKAKMAETPATESGKVLKNVLTKTYQNQHLQAFKGVFDTMKVESRDLLEEIRNKVLVWYETNLRSSVGEGLMDFVSRARVYLDKYLPSEEPQQ